MTKILEFFVALLIPGLLASLIGSVSFAQDVSTDILVNAQAYSDRWVT